MSVAFVLPSFAGGGAERVLLSLLAGAAGAGRESHLLVLDGRGPLAALVPAGIKPIDLATPRLRHAMPALLTRLRALAPRAVISTHGYVNLALLAGRWLLPAGTRIVVREANLPSLSLPEAPHSKWLRLGYRRLYRRADRVLATSERMAAEFAGSFGVPSARLNVLPNPVDLPTLRRAAVPPAREPGAGVRLVAAGRLTRQKGYDRLLDLFARLPPETRLTILGEGPDAATLRARATHLGVAGRLTLASFSAQPWPRYAGADAFLLPSRWEGMPNAALEALACGTPVIATPQSGGIAEVAAEAPVGAVSLAEWSEPFMAALQSLKPTNQPATPRPSLLPARYERAAVCDVFNALLAELL